ncbi:unnamed protein product, partial [marine sediment metagenome]
VPHYTQEICKYNINMENNLLITLIPVLTFIAGLLLNPIVQKIQDNKRLKQVEKYFYEIISSLIKQNNEQKDNIKRCILNISKLDENVYKYFSLGTKCNILINKPYLNKEIFLVRLGALNKSLEIKGILKPPIILGDINAEVDCVKFEIPNLRHFNGLPVRDKLTLSKSRLLLQTDKFLIKIDYQSQKKKLRNKQFDKGDYTIFHTGILEKKGEKKLTLSESINELETLSHFLSFLNGRRCSPIIRSGFLNQNERWKDITPYITDVYKPVFSWPVRSNIEGLNEIWNNFFNLWQDESYRDCLKTTLHWYFEANANSAFIEGSIVLIQNALELLFHWHIVEKLSYIP